MSEGVQSRRNEKLCFFWYSINIEKQIQKGLANVLNAIECPCDHRLLRFDPRYAINRFDKINRILCYASMTLGNNVVSDIVFVNGRLSVVLLICKTKIILIRNAATICTQMLISWDHYDALCQWQERSCNIIHFSKDISIIIMT